MSESLSLPDGIYFGMPDRQYHALGRLSASGLRDLIRGPMEFWENSAWWNPARSNRDTYAMALGRAYHKRLLEGADAFAAEYAPRFVPDEDALVTVQHLKTACRAEGLRVGGRKADLAERLATRRPDLPIALYQQQDYEGQNFGKSFLKPRDYETIQAAADMLDRDHRLRSSIGQGYNEVTILWTYCGLPMKSRLDDLVSCEITDLKTFAVLWHETRGQAMDRICKVIYEVQKAVYVRAVAEGRKLTAAGHVHVLSGPAPTAEFLQAFIHSKTNSFNLLLWQKPRVAEDGRFTLYRCEGQELAERTARTESSIYVALATYRAYRAHFGDQPWQQLNMNVMANVTVTNPPAQQMRSAAWPKWLRLGRAA